MTATELKTTYDQAFPSAVSIVGSTDVNGAAAPVGAGITAAGVPTATNYCIVSQNGCWYGYKRGPGGQISVTNVLANICTPEPTDHLGRRGASAPLRRWRERSLATGETNPPPRLARSSLPTDKAKAIRHSR